MNITKNQKALIGLAAVGIIVFCVYRRNNKKKSGFGGMYFDPMSEARGGSYNPHMERCDCHLINSAGDIVEALPPVAAVNGVSCTDSCVSAHTAPAGYSVLGSAQGGATRTR